MNPAGPQANPAPHLGCLPDCPFPMLQLSFAIALRSSLRFQLARPSPQALGEIRGNRIGKATLF